jgi:hypothetical protein
MRRSEICLFLFLLVTSNAEISHNQMVYVSDLKADQCEDVEQAGNEPTEKASIAAGSGEHV